MDTSSLNDSDNNTIKIQNENNYLTNTPTSINNSMCKIEPRVMQWYPQAGTEQSTITVALEQPVSNTSSPTLQQEIARMQLVFGKLVVQTSQQQQGAPASSSTNSNSDVAWITLVAQVPKLEETKVVASNEVPVSICILNKSDEVAQTWQFGVFKYYTSASEVQAGSKRSSSDFTSDHPSKRTSTSLEEENLFHQLISPFGDSPVNNSVETPDLGQTNEPLLSHSMPLSQPSTTNVIHSGSEALNPLTDGSFDHQYQDQAFSSVVTPSNMSFIQPSTFNEASTSNTTTNNEYPSSDFNSRFTPFHTNIQPSGTQLHYGNYDNNNNNVPINFHSYSTQQSPSNYSFNFFQSQQHFMIPMSNTAVNSIPVFPEGTGSDTNPFAGVLCKPNLKIIGNMEDIMKNWSEGEKSEGRRLVQFWRRQYINENQEHEIECGFEAIEQKVYKEQRIRENAAAQTNGEKSRRNPLVVSCIYWEKLNSYYITSVDCICLIEGLLGVHFTVEEKNRIRRNLEGFRPLTVSKSKEGSSDFFKVIMGFPHPKPRNIEKDLKVFPWESLARSLAKIIKKYTPSYSSTAAIAGNK